MSYALFRRSRSDKIFDAVNTFLLLLVLVVILFPLIFILSASVSDPIEVSSGNVWLWPKGFTLEGYERIFRDDSILRSYVNTITYTVVGTCINVVLTVLAAYPLSRKDFYGCKLFTIILTITMFFSGGMIPLYLVVDQLHLLDTIGALVLPTAINVFNVIITRTYFSTTVPFELCEASQVDGCSSIRYLFSILLPLSAPIIAVITLYYAVVHWNNYFDALIYLRDDMKYPLQLVLRNILIESQISVDMVDDAASIVEQQRIAQIIKYGVIVVGSLPMLCLYPFLQKYFVKGVMVGAVKG